MRSGVDDGILAWICAGMVAHSLDLMSRKQEALGAEDDGRRGVVNAGCRFGDVPDLSRGDGSVFPATGALLTMRALARCTADRTGVLAGKDRL